MSKETQIKKQNEFIKEKYDRINVTIPKGMKDKYRKHAESKSMSLNALINKLLKEDMEQG